MAVWFEEVVQTLGDLIWGKWTIALFIGIGIFFSMQLRWMQITKIKVWMYESVGKYIKKEKRKELSGLKSVCTLLSATIGTGNLAGVATALVAGGPGAIFWMWAAAVLGMMTAFAENVLGVLHRSNRAGGPMVYIEKMWGGCVLSKLYALLCILCGFGMGNLTQSNTAAVAMHEAFGMHPLVIAFALIIVLSAVFWGGRKTAGRVTLIVTPIMALLFVAASLWIIIVNCKMLPGAFLCIFREAFRVDAAAGGAAGYGIGIAMRYGVARGVFTNEAGIGTSVFANEQDEHTTPKQQGYTAIFAVFADTIVMCTLTALVLLVSGAYNIEIYENAWQQGRILELSDGAALLINAFETAFGEAGGGFLALLTLLFAFSTLLAWSRFAWQAFRYLTGGKWKILFCMCFLCTSGIGTFAASHIVWELSDAVNGVMAVINISAILFLCVDIFEYAKRNIDEY